MSNFPFTVLGTSRLGAEARCQACGAGALVSFNWHYARERQSPEDMEKIALFSQWIELRRGSLHRCRVCDEVWHLDRQAERMTHVEAERLPLILDWNRAAIELPANMVKEVRRIGPTPPDVYGNGSGQRVTPCEVVSRSGEHFERAMICVQLEAPVQVDVRFRLGSEIAEVKESVFALPRSVREASGRAKEMRMGFSPTLIEMPDGRRFVMNGMTSFMAVQGYAASDARVATGSYFSEERPPSFVETPDDVVYFIVDGDPYWASEPSCSLSQAPARTSWLKKLLGR